MYGRHIYISLAISEIQVALYQGNIISYASFERYRGLEFISRSLVKLNMSCFPLSVRFCKPIHSSRCSLKWCKDFISVMWDPNICRMFCCIANIWLLWHRWDSGTRIKCNIHSLAVRCFISKYFSHNKWKSSKSVILLSTNRSLLPAYSKFPFKELLPYWLEDERIALSFVAQTTQTHKQISYSPPRVDAIRNTFSCIISNLNRETLHFGLIFSK